MNSNNMMSLWPSLRPVALAVVVGLSLGAAGSARAGEEETPLYLSLAHQISRDSNFSRDSERQAETINSTAVLAGIEKAYGRQTYRGSVKLAKSRYAHYGDQLNNDGKDVDGSVSSEFLRDWRVTIGGSYNENLNKIQDNNATGNRVTRNIRTFRDGNLALQYGVGGMFAVAATYDANKLSYSAPSYQRNNANQHANGLKFTYFSTDLLSFGVGQRLVRTRFPVNRDGETQSDNNIDLFTNWQVSGLSFVNAVVTRRRSVFGSDPDHTIRGWTGNVNWQYIPDAFWTHSLGWTRQTGADRQIDTWTVQGGANKNNTELVNRDLNEVTTTLNYMARLKPTSKISLTGNYNLARYSRDNAYLYQTSNNLSSTESDSSLLRTITLGASYAVTRAVNLGCSYQKYKQTEGAERIGFDGHSVDCTASVTID